MPVTFGSVGDIIAVSLLVKDVLDAFDKSRGSSSEYQELIRELWSLDRALLEIEQLSRRHRGAPDMAALCKTFERTVESCRVSVEAFTKKIRKYKSSLDEGSSKNFFNKAAMKVRWQVTEKDEVDRFRKEINAHSGSMNMLLTTASLYAHTYVTL